MQGQVQTILRSIPTLRRTSSTSIEKEAKKKPGKIVSNGMEKMKVAALAEALILQSIEDLWSKTERKASVEFFLGEGFQICADLAGMKIVERLRLFRLLRKIDPKTFDSRHSRKLGMLVASGL